MFPAASRARTITVFVPTSSGTSKDHDVVPCAVPESPPRCQVTAVTPLSSRAQPEMRSLAAEGDHAGVEGDVIAIAGLVESTVLRGASGGTGAAGAGGPGFASGEALAYSR